MKRNTLKAIFKILLLLLVIFGFTQNSTATTYYWIGAGTTYSDATAWSTSSGGASCGCVPGSADDIILDGGGTDMTIDADPGTNSFTINATYSGNVTFSAGVTMTINGAFSIAGGTFDGTNAADCNVASFSISGGSFTSTTGNLFIAGNMSSTGGTFTPNGGTVYITVTVSAIVISNGLSFYNLTLERVTSGSSTFNIGTTSSHSITVNNTLFLTVPASSRSILIGTGKINLTGNLDNSANTGSGSASQTGTIVFSGTTAQTITGSTSASNGLLPNITISNTTATVSIASGNFNIRGNYVINSGAAFDDGGFNTTLYGNITNTGTLTNSGTIICTSTAAQSLKFGAGTTLNNLTISKTSGTATLNDAINISNLLSVPTSGGTFNANGNLTFLSTGAGISAQIGTVGSTATLSGNYTVQRYIPAGRNWRFLASPVSQSFSSSWQNNIFITGHGSGGSVCPTLTNNSNGFDATTGNNPSVYTYTESSSSWTALSATSVSLTPGVGYRVYVRGDRTAGTPCNQLDGTTPAPTSAVTLSATGTFASTTNYGTVSLTLTKSGTGWNLVGNPYQATLDWLNSTWNTDRGGSTNATMSSSFYTWNPNTSTYGTFVGGVGTNGATRYISPGQAFFVSVTTIHNGKFLFKEAYKATSQSGSGLFKADDPIPVLYAKFNDVSSLPIYSDETAIALRPTATRSFDTDFDAVAFSFSTGNIQNYNSASSTKYAINSIPTIASGSTDTVYLEVNYPSANGSFSLAFNNKNMPSGTSIYLVDNYLSTFINITSSYKYTYSTDSTIASRASDRFMVIFGNNIGTLPIVLSKFTAEKVNKNVNLSWTTSSEINNNFFDVERSIGNQNNYTKIGEVKAVGNSIVTNNYSLVDLLPSLNSTNYYRLKQVDLNTKYSYSPVLAVDFNNNFNAIHASSGIVNVYPVPSKENINITLNNSYKGDVTINIYNLVGKLILTSSGTISNENQITQNISNLNTGVYLIEVSSKDGEFKDQAKFVKE